MDPYNISGPANISFSGGRSSGKLVKKVLDAHGGKLPDDVIVTFANTGKERPETLRFVHDCATHWNIPIVWLEWRATPAQADKRRSLAEWIAKHDPERRMVAEAGFECVGFNSASRNGEPFAALIAMKQRLPNWQERWCTEFLKVRTITAYLASLGWHEGSYSEVIGLGKDEGWRLLRAHENANFRRDRKTKEQVPRVPPRLIKHPLATAKVTKADVMAFWQEQPFDLQLQPHEGNCDLCFMKGRKIRKRIIRDTPGTAPWWDHQETSRNQFFDRRDRVRDLINEVRYSPDLFDAPGLDELDEEHDAECGLLCAVE